MVIARVCRMWCSRPVPVATTLPVCDRDVPDVQHHCRREVVPLPGRVGPAERHWQRDCEWHSTSFQITLWPCPRRMVSKRRPSTRNQCCFATSAQAFGKTSRVYPASLCVCQQCSWTPWFAARCSSCDACLFFWCTTTPFVKRLFFVGRCKDGVYRQYNELRF